MIYCHSAQNFTVVYSISLEMLCLLKLYILSSKTNSKILPSTITLCARFCEEELEVHSVECLLVCCTQVGHGLRVRAEGKVPRHLQEIILMAIIIK